MAIEAIKQLAHQIGRTYSHLTFVSGCFTFCKRPPCSSVKRSRVTMNHMTSDQSAVKKDDTSANCSVYKFKKKIKKMVKQDPWRFSCQCVILTLKKKKIIETKTAKPGKNSTC